MLRKLAFRNIGKSIKDYAIYFATLVLGVAIFYMFNSIYAQRKIMVVTETLNQSMKGLNQILGVISVFVAIILAFLIIYANNFFIKRRKKEIGIYMTLGMKRTQISIVLIIETFFIALLALVVGLIFGIIASQFMSLFTAKIFEADMSEFAFIFSATACIKSVIYFGIIFAVIIIFNVINISKIKIIDLLAASKKNERLKIRSLKKAFLIMLIASISLIVSYILILKNGMININVLFFASLVFGTIGTVLFFFSLTTIITKLLQKNKNRYFKNLNMFVVKQLNNKVNTNFISISIVCIMLLLVIGIFSCGYSVQDVVSNELKESISYDYSLFQSGEYSIEDLPKELLEFDGIQDKAFIKVYNEINPRFTLQKIATNYKTDNKYFYNNLINIISIDDFNSTRKIQGLNEITLGKDEYAIISDSNFYKDIKVFFDKQKPLIELNEKKLNFKKSYDTNISLSDFNMYIVVNNDLTKGLTLDKNILNINCINETKNKKYTTLIEEIKKTKGIDSLYYYISKLEIKAQSISTKSIVAFLSIYLGIVFIIACAAILAIQQLSEAQDNKERYELLKKLGVKQKLLNKALFKQIMIYFLMPLLLAIIHSIVGLIAANDVISKFGKIDVSTSLGATAIIVIFIYGLYFMITFIGSKNIINQ